jgi:hypothetical protein
MLGYADLRHRSTNSQMKNLIPDKRMRHLSNKMETSTLAKIELHQACYLVKAADPLGRYCDAQWNETLRIELLRRHRGHLG